MSGIIEVNNLSFGYTPQSRILENLSFEVMPGAFVGIAGPNGAGKTTLLNLLCGLLSLEAGSIRIDAVDIESYSVRELARKVAVVRQEFVPAFDFTVEETVMMARTPYLGTFGFEGKADREIVTEAIEATDTARFASRPLGNLSGGERQRVFIARALAQDTEILLLDEPTSFLDFKHQVGIYDLLKAAQLEKGKTIVAVTHDINLATQYCDEILLLGADSSYHIGKSEAVLAPEQIRKVFGVDVFAGEVGQEKFFMPLGKLAKDSKQTGTAPGNNLP
ncbi:MAG: ABC transporter ATP-binding protein [Planctomycetota bacterium]|jgi:iron complex transport system ATP-binding protein